MHEGRNMKFTDIIASYIRSIIDTKCSKYYGGSEAYERDYERIIGAIMLIIINSNPFISTMLKLSEEEPKVNA